MHGHRCFHLTRGYGFPVEFRSIRDVSHAAMLRVGEWEDRWNGGLRIHERSRQLLALEAASANLIRHGLYVAWYRRAIVHQLADVATAATAAGHSPSALLAALTKQEPRPWPQAVEQTARGGFQKAALRAVQANSTYYPERRVRAKLKRFGFLDRRQAERCLARLRALARVVPPRVWSASFGFVWNRWATARRRQVLLSHCQLGCLDGDDSEEHYARCPVIRAFGREALGVVHRYTDGLEDWCLASAQHRDAAQDQWWWAKVAVLQYATLRVTNATRADGTVLRNFDPRRALWQALYEATRDSPRLAAAIRRHA